MIKRIVIGVAALFGLGAAAATAVVAAAFALYALLKNQFGEAGGAALVALAFAVLVGLGALVAGMAARGGHKPSAEPGFMERLAQAARERPLLAAGGALAAGLIALRNPQVIASVVGAVLASRAADSTTTRKRR